MTAEVPMETHLRDLVKRTQLEKQVVPSESPHNPLPSMIKPEEKDNMPGGIQCSI
jgi:hypothetical protein